MWDYNRDGIIDDRDEDEYWDDEYFQKLRRKREKEFWDTLLDEDCEFEDFDYDDE